jgi:hypothetical protein
MNSPIIAYRANMGVQTSAPFANTKSLQFDGIDDYVDCGNITALDNVTSATWSIWSNSLITTSILLDLNNTYLNNQLIN